MSATHPTTLYTALLAAQRAMGPVRKDASNPAFRSKYASLQSVFDTIEGPLWDNGLVLVQRFTPDNGEAILVTELIHAESGERLSSAVRVVSKDPSDPQKVGSAITYYRRYSLLALLGLTPEEDDDGNAAAKPAPPAKRPQPAPNDNDAMPTRPYTKAEFEHIIDRCWTMVEDGAAVADIKSVLNAARTRMSEEQRIVARQQLTAIETAVKERATVAAKQPAGIAG